MKFSIVANMSRFHPSEDMRQIARETLELIQLADEGGFEIAWVAEHHAIEVTIAPNPFTILTHWANQTKRIRLGTGVVSAPYWHPIRLAGEAALTDLLSDGRLELGLGRGAYQYEFDRLAGGMPQGEGGRYLREIVPAVKALWQGDYAHNGELWQFPVATSVPKPIQQPHPRMWIAARNPDTFDWAIKNGCHVMSTPLQRPHGEVINLCQRFEEALHNNPQVTRPEHMMLRRACVYSESDEWQLPVKALTNFCRYFENLFCNRGEVRNGFAEPVDFSSIANKTDYSTDSAWENHLFGTPAEIIQKLKRYEETGVHHFLYGASFGLSHAVAMKSLTLFIQDVMPSFRER